ncbi:MAG: DUF4197 domain-containing protein [Lewinella sp.]|nr:DUF4197 domain-containing protein [Lewinella sp.]
MAFSACTTQQINSTLGTLLNGGLSSETIADGLKEALNLGARRGSDELSAQGGYFNDLAYRILLPPEAQKVTNKLRGIPGFSDLETQVIRKINQGAEDAAKEAAPIFLEAIKQMTIQDALGILKGDKDAATQYLQRVTFEQLYAKFNPVIVTSLDKFSARTIWSDAVNTYNRIPLVTQVNNDLDDYVTRQALNGLFKKVALEELNIRTNLNARTSELLRKVFAQQDATGK